ncbi:MAG: anti-phage dCTP deaminase [Thermodesulfobacteriota bacterium]
MVKKFFGELEDLKRIIAALPREGEWIPLNENQIQFKTVDGTYLNWYPSTGTIYFQGLEEAKKSFEEAFETAIPVAVPSDLASVTHSTESSTCDSDEDSLVSSPLSAQAVEVPEDHRAKRRDVGSLFGGNFSDSELIIGLVGAVGTEMDKITTILKNRLLSFSYQVEEIKISQDVIPQIIDTSYIDCSSEYERINELMTAGNMAREKTQDCSVLALGASARIGERRDEDEKGEPKFNPRRAYIINSLKHHDEVERLREIYSEGFFLIGVYADAKCRYEYLTKDKLIDPGRAEYLMDRDADEHSKYGQKTSATFHLSDFFVLIDEDQYKMKNSVWRIVDILFGYPFATPTFDEFAMFMAFSASLRSADLSRQVGAVISIDENIISMGANDCPKFGGGLYWPHYNSSTHEIVDAEDGRDYKRGYDSNDVEKEKIIDDILNKIGTTRDKESIMDALRKSKVDDITEYGRVVHAEMEALLSCSRSNISCKDGTLYCTTFPCHNCAKHIIAAGLKRVVYVEPYPKSRAAEFHSDSITLGFASDSKTVNFEPFVGIGPRRFFDLFSMKLGSGYPLKRKDSKGNIISWDMSAAKLRTQMSPCSYIERETMASSLFNKLREEVCGDGEAKP